MTKNYFLKYNLIYNQIKYFYLIYYYFFYNNIFLFIKLFNVFNILNYNLYIKKILFNKIKKSVKISKNLGNFVNFNLKYILI